MSLYLSDILSQCVSVSLITSFCITLSRSLSLSLFLHYGHSLCLFFPPISPHTIRLLFSIQVRSFTGSPFSDEFDEDNQMAKFDTNAYGIWKTNPSYIHSQSRYLTLYPCISFLIFLPLILVLSHWLLHCLSLSFDASPTLSSYVPLSNNYYLSIYQYLTFTLRIAIILLLDIHISLSHLFSVSLTQPLTVVHFIFATLFLSFLHSCYNVIIIVIVLCFVLIIIIF